MTSGEALIKGLLYEWGIPEPIFEYMLQQVGNEHGVSIAEEIRKSTTIDENEGMTVYFLEEDDWADELMALL